MSKDELYIRRCFQLALKGNNAVGTNPFVGAVIVYKDKVIGEGWHQQYGSHHAEVNAFASVKEEDRKYLSESTIYVNLEPCFHYGKTPPCCDLILREKIKRVVVSCVDPHHNVEGKSITRLRAEGVEVKVGVLEDEGRFLIRRFISLHQEKRPYVILKYAKSEDGFIGRIGERTPLTGGLAKIYVHKWRSIETAILIGKRTAEIDNPKLTNRVFHGNHPIRIILDGKGQLEPSLNIFNKEARTIMVSEKKHPVNHVETLEYDLKSKGLKGMLEKLTDYGIKSILVEGGRETLQTFIRAGLWDEARILTAPIYLGKGVEAPRLDYEGSRHEIHLEPDRLEVIFRNPKYHSIWQQDWHI